MKELLLTGICVVVMLIAVGAHMLITSVAGDGENPAETTGAVASVGSSQGSGAGNATTDPSLDPTANDGATDPDNAYADIIDGIETLPDDEDVQYSDLSVPMLGDGVSDATDSDGPFVDPDDILLSFPHYVSDNDARYRSFIAAYPDMPVTRSLALVNIGADYGFYNNISGIENPSDLLALCNKNWQLPEDYVPANLRVIADTRFRMTNEAATAFERMRAKMYDDTGLELVVVSTYRSFKYQTDLHARYANSDPNADSYSARAGHSEHQTGLAIDMLHTSPSGSLRSANFQKTGQYEWMVANAHKYGFILRYPKGYESVTGYVFEPWHWRYIGVEDATRMVNSGIKTFDEYIGTYYYGVLGNGTQTAG
jgi:D-alanyl-D-alanine carboxypeptidase